MMICSRFVAVVLAGAFLPVWVSAEEKKTDSVPDSVPGSAGSVPSAAGSELAKRLAEMPVGTEYLCVVITPAGVEDALMKSEALLRGVAGEGLLVRAANENKPEENGLYGELVKSLRITDFPFVVVYGRAGEPLLGTPVVVQTVEEAAARMGEWVAEAGLVAGLKAKMAVAPEGERAGLLAQILAKQTVGFAVSVDPALPVKLREGVYREARELDAVRAEADDFVAKKQFQELFDSIVDPLAAATGKGDLEECLAIVGRLIDERKPSPLAVQRLEMQRFRMCANARNYDRALEFLAKAEQAAPGSPIAGRIPKFREQIEAARAKAAAQPADKPAGPDAPAEGQPK
jgi:hypothetical protein